MFINSLAIARKELYEKCNMDSIWASKLEQRLGYYVPKANKETYKKYLHSGTPHIMDCDKNPIVFNEVLQSRRDITKLGAYSFVAAFVTVNGECFVFNEDYIYTTTEVKDFSVYEQISIVGPERETCVEVVIGLQRETCVEVVKLLEPTLELISSETHPCGDVKSITSKSLSWPNHLRGHYQEIPSMAGVKDVVNIDGESIVVLYDDGRLMCHDSQKVIDTHVIRLCSDFDDDAYLCCYIREPQ